MNDLEFKNMIDDYCTTWQTLKSFEGFIKKNKISLNDFDNFRKLLSKFKKLGDLICSDLRKPTSDFKILQAWKGTLCLRNEPDFIEEYNHLRKKYDENESEMTKAERQRYWELVFKLLETTK